MVRKIFTVICALVLFFLCGELLRYVLVDDTGAYTRVMLHEMYTADENIDIAFVGSSHAYRSFVPKILDAGFGAYTFNAGSSSQLMDGSLAMIQEICTYHCPKKIFLELYHGMMFYDVNAKKRKNMTATYILSDYMKPSWRKISYLLKASNQKHYVNSFIIARRNWKKLIDYNYIYALVKKKQSDAYKNYRLVHKEGAIEYYVERGFVANNKVVDSGVSWNKSAYGNISIAGLEKSDRQRTLIEIINYCKAQGVELIFLVAPLPEWSIAGLENYQDYYDYVKSIADAYEVEFCDFNLCNPKYFDASDRLLFKDEDHLNTRGAEKFSEVVASYFTGKIPKDELFYKTLKEKYDAEPPKVFGLAGLTKEGKGHVISNRACGLEYRLEALPKDSAPRIIQDYSEEKEFAIPSGEHGWLVLSWRMKGTEGQEEKIEAKY